jgi:tetratricopeptide (TPR) repeat protein
VAKRGIRAKAATAKAHCKSNKVCEYNSLPLGGVDVGSVMRYTQQPELQRQDDRIKLCVVHGHLAFARFPVLAGHYDGDVFAGTEARLDRALDSRLSERRKMGLYPGAIGTSTVLLDPNSKPCGAVVVGLGEPAGLSVGTLRRTLRQGVLALVAGQLDQCHSAPGAADSETLLKVSALLVGSGEGGLDRSSCAQALMEAASEAQLIVAGLGTLHARVGEVEIVELYEDRALAIWRAVEEVLTADPGLSRSFELEPEIRWTPLGRGHAPLGRDRKWWQPIQITMSGNTPEERSLLFTVGGGLARVEARTIAANLDLVRPLVRRAFRNIDVDGAATSPGRTLFELLWPGPLKDRSAEERARRLILDVPSAALPWELLDDRRPWTRDGEGASVSAIEPPAVRAGMVRQLLETRFREEIVIGRGEPKALVIGDPGAAPTEGFPKLPGAEQEARSVAELLDKTHDVKLLIGAAAAPEQICKQLFAEAWEIVHICAHGVVDQELIDADGIKRRMTGVVLGGGVVLGPSALSKLAVSPSIFFVNCCHLGEIDAAAEDKARQASLEGRPEFAASVAVELVRLGVRCVIAAGWAVDDEPAKVFGTRFYGEMLKGASFGEAVRGARKAAYSAQANSNTWGAYQCYGDPDYRLREAPADGEERILKVAEAIEAAQQIREDVNIGLERDPDAQRSRLFRIEGEARRRTWLELPELRVALGEARAELNDLPEAIEHYEAAVSGENASSIKISAVEQLANLRVRNAVTAFRNLPPDRRDPAQTIATIEASLRTVQALAQAVGDTQARLALQGGCWKRLAQVQAPSDEADRALEKMADCYDRAAAIAGGDRGYPRLMACNARICIAARSGTDCDREISESLQRLSESKPPDDADFWRLVRWADVRLNVAVLRAPSPSEEEDEIVMAYRRAWRHVGSPIKLRSVVEQLEFFEDIFAHGAPASAAKRESIIASVAKLRFVLETEFLGKKPN